MFMLLLFVKENLLFVYNVDVSILNLKNANIANFKGLSMIKIFQVNKLDNIEKKSLCVQDLNKDCNHKRV